MMDFCIKIYLLLTLLMMIGLEYAKGALTLTSSPSNPPSGSSITLSCMSSVPIQNVTWRRNGELLYFDPTVTKRVFGSVYRSYTVTQKTQQYDLKFQIFTLVDKGTTWVCEDQGVTSNAIILFQDQNSNSGDTSNTVQPVPLTSDYNLPLIAGLCALAGLIIIILTCVLCWCLYRSQERPVKTERRVIKRDSDSVRYIHRPSRPVYVDSMYGYAPDRPARSIDMMDNPIYFQRSSADLFSTKGSMHFPRPQVVGSRSPRSDTNSNTQFVDVVFDSYENKNPDVHGSGVDNTERLHDVREYGDVYAKTMKRPRVI